MSLARLPLLTLSAALVFGAVALVLRNFDPGNGGLQPGFEQLVHARIPWLLLGTLWGGLALGIAAFVRRRSVLRGLVVGLELVPVALVSWYVPNSFLPPHELAIEVGDPFPAYALADHDGVLREVDPARAGERALYIFYRGDW